MFFQLKMFEGLTTRTVFKLTESDLVFAQRLRLYCSVQDWDNADALSRLALCVAEKFASGWIPEEVCQIYADIGLACRSTPGKHAKAIAMCQRAISIAQEFGYASLESSSSANLGYAYICAGKWEDAVEALEHARACMEWQASVENDAQLGCELLENLADAHQELGNYERAIDLYSEMRVLARDGGLAREEFAAVERIGVIFALIENHEAAAKALEDTLEILQKLELPRKRDEHDAEIRCLAALGTILYKTGKSFESISRFEAALAISKASIHRNQSVECNVLACLGQVFNSLGQFSRAICMHTRALEMARDNGDVSLQACALGSLGLAFGCMGKYQDAITNHERCLVLAVRMGDSKLEGISQCNLGGLFTIIGDHDKAIRTIEMGISKAKQVDDIPCQGRGYMSLGECFMHLQQYEQAIQKFELALPICVETNDDIGQAASNMQMGACYIFMAQDKQGTARLDAVAKASEIYSNVLDIAESNPHHVVRNLRAQVYLEKAKLVYMQDNLDEAVEWLERHLDLVVTMGRTLCMGCGLVRCNQDEMLSCSHCKAVRYCNKDHQRMSWIGDGHKFICPLLRKWRRVMKGKEARDSVQQDLVDFLTSAHPPQSLRLSAGGCVFPSAVPFCGTCDEEITLKSNDIACQIASDGFS